MELRGVKAQHRRRGHRGSCLLDISEENGRR